MNGRRICTVTHGITIAILILAATACASAPSGSTPSADPPVTEPEPRLSPHEVDEYLAAASPSPGERGVGLDTEINLSFTVPIAERSLSYVSINPPVPFEASLHWFVAPATQLTLNTALLQADTTYVVRLDPGFRLDGRPLDSPWTYRFTTGVTQ